MKYYFFSGVAQDPTTGAVTYWSQEKSNDQIPSFDSIKRLQGKALVVPPENIIILNYKEMTEEEYFAF